MLACVTFAWLPTLLLRDGGQGTAVVAMAMKSGHIVFYGMEVPLTRKRYSRLPAPSHTHITSSHTHMTSCSLSSSPALSLLLVTELPEAGAAVACSLAWQSSGEGKSSHATEWRPLQGEKE